MAGSSKELCAARCRRGRHHPELQGANGSEFDGDLGGHLPISNTVTSCPSDATTILELFTAGSIQNWALVGPDSAHYEYPTGLQLPPGTAIAFTSLIGSCNIIADLHGYLTAN